jgi:spermidine synthase
MMFKNKWFGDHITPHIVQLHVIDNIVYSGQTRFQQVEILDLKERGRCLVLDGKIQSTEQDEFIYHEALVHPPLILHPHPRRVCIIGGGEGAILREVLNHHTVEKALMIDIDEEVVKICQRFLPSLHKGSFRDPRVGFIFTDARRHLEETDETFDIIILDLTDPLPGGPSSSTYTREFYSLVRARLSPGGIVSVQAGCSSLGNISVFTQVNHTLASVFPCVFPYEANIPSFGSNWGFSLVSPDNYDPLSLTSEEIDRRIAERVTGRLRFYDGIAHQGMFFLPKYLREGIKGEGRAITDENPLENLWS